MIRRLILTLLITLLAPSAYAADLSVAWTNPTQNTDGSTIPATGAGSLTQTRVEWGACASAGVFGTKAGEVVVAAPAVAATINGVTPGSTVCVQAFTKNTYGSESAASAVVSKVVPAPVPQPPVLVTVSIVAYEVLPHPIEGTRLGRNVGTVPLGTACGTEPVVYTSRGTYFEVPRKNVTLEKGPKSAVLVALCARAA